MVSCTLCYRFFFSEIRVDITRLKLTLVEYLEVRVYLADAHVTSLVVLDQFEELAGQEEQSKQRWCLRILRMHP